MLIGMLVQVLIGFIDSFDVKEKIGFSMVFFILFMLGVNVLIVTVDFCQ